MNSRHHEDDIEAQACEWVIRVHDLEFDREDPVPDPADRLEAFLAWISQSRRHFNAARTAVETSKRLRLIDPHSLIVVEELLCQPFDNVVRLPEAESQPPSVERARATLLPWAAYGAMLTLFFVPLLFQSLGAWPVRYGAEVGQRIFVPLEDRSTVELNTRTHIEVSYGPRSRVVTLLSGEAIFDVRHDASRPFRVVSGNAIVEDIGTRFAVYRHADGTTTVTVLEGRVEVSAGANDAHLAAGQAATVSRKGNRAKVAVEDIAGTEISRRLSWQVGVLSFHGETLAEAIGEVNRYNERQIVIDNPTVAAWQVGGTFQAVDVDAFLGTLERLYPLHAVASTQDAGVIELQRREPSP
jgi:ferric-dicitrate binding protein FerR (iron transport regulator)